MKAENRLFHSIRMHARLKARSIRAGCMEIRRGPKMILNATALKSTPVLEEASGRLPDRIYERIMQQIVAGEFGVGDRLPSENQLGAEYGVSRAVVREAL